MSDRSDLGNVLRIWLQDGPSTMPDRVVDVVADRIGRQPQRRAWPFPGRTNVTTQLKLIAALAAAIVVAVVGYTLLPGTSGPGRPTTAPTPTAAATQTAATVGIQDVPDSGQVLAPGQWRFHPVVGSQNLSVVADVPAGWRALETQHGLENVSATNSPPAGIAIPFEAPAHGVFSDPCHWDLDGTGTWEQDGDVEVGPAVADLVDALRANTSFTTSAASSVAFGRYSGQQLELRFPTDLDPASCDGTTGEENGFYRVFPDTIYSQGQANIWQVSIVDVAGARFVAIIEHFPGTAPDKLAEAEAIVESFAFTP